MKTSSNKGKPSFFDGENCAALKSIWEPVTQDIQYNLSDVKIAQKQSRNSNGRKQINLLLIEEYLYILKDRRATKQLHLMLTKLDLLPDNIVRLTKNQQTLEFQTNEYQYWRQQLIYKCFQSSFHEEYQVQKMIGKGSFAKVYLAVKKETGVEYAIKAFNKEFMLEQFKGKESLKNEIKVMRKFNHENLVSLYEVYETVNSIYFVIDILRGGELLQRVKQKGMLQQKELQKLMFNLMKALAHIHARNCIHRDLKPENLLLKGKENDYDIVIADFGLAALLDGEIIFKRCGTPGFVAPEILLYKEDDKFYDTRCDVFSAGIIFYVLLTGKQPFQGQDYKQILRANKSCEINFLHSQIVNSSQTLQDLLRKMLQGDPAKRINSSDCLKHPYFQELATEEIIPNYNQSQEGLQNYEKDFTYGLTKKGVDSQEIVIGSLELQSRTPVINGKVDTIGSLSNYSHSSLNKIVDNTPKNPGASKFSQFSQKVNSINIQHQNSQEHSQSPSARVSKNDDLHKKAIKNSLFNQQKKVDDEVNDENPQLQSAMFKLQGEGTSIKLLKSFSQNNSTQNSPKNGSKK